MIREKVLFAVSSAYLFLGTPAPVVHAQDARSAVDEQFCIDLTSQYKAGMTDLCRAMHDAVDAGWVYLASANENDIWFVMPGQNRFSIWARIEYRTPVNSRVRSSQQLFQFECGSHRARMVQGSAFEKHGLLGAPIDNSTEPYDWLTAPPGSILDVLLKYGCEYERGAARNR